MIIILGGCSVPPRADSVPAKEGQAAVAERPVSGNSASFGSVALTVTSSSLDSDESQLILKVVNYLGHDLVFDEVWVDYLADGDSKLKSVHFVPLEAPEMVKTVYIEPGRKQEPIPTAGAREWNLPHGMAKNFALHISSGYWGLGRDLQLLVRFRHGGKYVPSVVPLPAIMPRPTP